MVPLRASSSSKVAVTAFNRIADRWGLDPGQRALLLGRSGRTAYRWAKPGGSAESSRPLQRDTLERISLLIGIYEDIRAFFGSGPAADGWITRPNADFGGEPPLNRLLAGNVEDIVAVRRYLGATRQGW